MIRWIRRLPDIPEARLFTNLVTTLIAGVLASAFVVDITIDGKIHWAATWRSKTFYLLLAFAVLWAILQLLFLNHDRDVKKFADDEHCLAYVRKMQLEAMAKDLKSNPGHAEEIDFTIIMKQLKIGGQKK